MFFHLSIIDAFVRHSIGVSADWTIQVLGEN